MLKKLSAKMNFVLIGIVVGLFVGVSIRQALGDTGVPGTVRADNLTVNTSGQYTNGLIVANGNALVSGNVGIGTITPTVKLDVVGDIKTSTRLCIGTTCINETQLQALLSGNAVPDPGHDDSTLCSSYQYGASSGASGVKPTICSGKRVRSAVNEYITDGVGGVQDVYYLPYLHKTEHDECYATSPMPSQLQMVSTPNGCKLQGVVYESGKFDWIVTNEFGSSTGDFTVESFVPDVTLTFPSVCSGAGCKLCPDATVGEPFLCTLRTGTTGNWTGKKISFSISGFPEGLSLVNTDPQVITGPDPTEDNLTNRVTGTPTTAGTYKISFCAGNGTEAHAAFCLVPSSTFVVKPSTDSSVKSFSSNSPSGPWINNNELCNPGTLYQRITGVNKNSNPPLKGCASPAASSDCLNATNHRLFTSEEWINDSTVQTVLPVNKTDYPMGKYDFYVSFGSTVKKVGSDFLKACGN